MSREQQFEFAQKWWMSSIGFDEGAMFQFSYNHFSDICRKLGFEKGVVDTHAKVISLDSGEKPQEEDIIYIERGKRENTVEKKITLSGETIEKIELLLGGKLSNVDKSKAIEAILAAKTDELLAKKEEGKFGLAYRPTELKRLV
jgi:hypothetical protein